MYMCLCINEYIRAVTLYLNHQYRQIRKLFLVFNLIILENFILMKNLLISSSCMRPQQRTSWGQTVWHYRLKVSSCQLSIPAKGLRHKIFVLSLSDKRVWNIIRACLGNVCIMFNCLQYIFQLFFHQCIHLDGKNETWEETFHNYTWAILSIINSASECNLCKFEGGMFSYKIC